MTTLATRWPISRGQDDKHPSITRSTDRDGIWCTCPQKHSIARLQQWQKVSLLVTNLWLLKFNYLYSSENFLKLQKWIKYGFIYVFVKWKQIYMQFFCSLVYFKKNYWGYTLTFDSYVVSNIQYTRRGRSQYWQPPGDPGGLYQGENYVDPAQPRHQPQRPVPGSDVIVLFRQQVSTNVCQLCGARKWRFHYSL